MFQGEFVTYTKHPLIKYQFQEGRKRELIVISVCRFITTNREQEDGEEEVY